VRARPDFSFEAATIARGLSPVAGVDEAGRGPLAGPVVAAAVILDPGDIPEGLDDSKALSARRRGPLCEAILARASVGVGIASVEEIDDMNILRAAHLAMCRAIDALPRVPGHVLIDGNMIPRDLTLSAEAIVKGDARSQSIAAASIVAKTRRDQGMLTLAQQFPGYGWETNMGYGTPAHLMGLKRHGATTHHRRSFRPVHNILFQEN